MANNQPTQEKQGIRDPYVAMSEYNALEYIIEQKVRQLVNTSFLGRVDSCTSTGSGGPAGAVSATPMVAQTDADGNALPMASIPAMPHGRLQGGIAAIVIDPVPGDIGIFSACKADSSTIKVGTTEPQRPGSYRSFDQADSCLVATVSNKAPEIWLELRQDKKGVLHCPQGIVIETPEGGDGITITDGKGGKITLKDGKCTIEAPNGILLDTPQTTITGNLTATGEKGSNIGMTGTFHLNGSMTSTGDQTAGSISQMHHTHTGVETGSGNTGEPQ